jgi:hypothetical protein
MEIPRLTGYDALREVLSAKQSTEACAPTAHVNSLKSLSNQLLARRGLARVAQPYGKSAAHRELVVALGTRSTLEYDSATLPRTLNCDMPKARDIAIPIEASI